MPLPTASVSAAHGTPVAHGGSAARSHGFPRHFALLNALAALRDTQSFPLSHGTAMVVSPEQVPRDLAASTRLAHAVIDHRYYEVVHHALAGQFTLKYILLRDSLGEFRGLHPCFIVRQNILAGIPRKAAAWADFVRRRFPHFLTLKMLMLGNPAGPSRWGLRDLDAAPDDVAWTTRALHDAVTAFARASGIRIVVLKDFHATERPLLQGLTTSASGYQRLPSMPMTALPLRGLASFDHYMQDSLSKVTRKGLRRKFRDAATCPLTMAVTHDISDCADDLCRLYQQVYDRASLTFEKLNPRFFLELSQRMPDRARFFLWRNAARELVAASVTLVNTDHSGTERALYDLYLCMDYRYALDLHLYFVTMRDVIDWCIDRNLDTYYSTPLNYDAKQHLRHHLVPLDLYVRHLSPLLNPPFKWAMSFAEPTRHDKILARFPNFHALRS